MSGKLEKFRPELTYSDGTEMFRSPSEPKPCQNVTLRIRVAYGSAASINLVNNDDIYEMDYEASDVEHIFDYYTVTVALGSEPFNYHFEIETLTGRVIYDRTGVKDEVVEDYEFLITPGFKTPEWSKGAVIYQIYVDRFCNGDPTNDVLTDEYNYIGDHVKHVENWDRYPEKLDVRDFYGGDIAGIISKIGYLKELGIEAIYLNPMFVSPSNHKYDAQDYDNIDPHYGIIKQRRGYLLAEGNQDNSDATSYIDAVTDETNRELTDKLFIELVEKCHENGIKVILDGVFNHCGSFNKWLDREGIYSDNAGYPDGAFKSEDSPYRNYFSFNDENGWPNNDSYDGWWGNDTLPKLNYEGSQELYDYIMGIARKWVSPPYNCDGWRLDVAADLGHSLDFNHRFWADFRKNVKKANPNAIILAEHYGNARDWLKGDQWDTTMNYDAFMEPLTWFFTGMEKHSDFYNGALLNNGRSFADALIYNMVSFQTPSLLVSMNELSNHDHSRFLTRTNHKVGRTASLGPEAAEKDVNPAVMREAVMFQMTWPGAPTVYYGDEAGVCGWTDPDNRRTYPWGNEDQNLLKFHKEMIAIHKAYAALKTGSTKILLAGTGIFSFARFNEEEILIVTFNNNDVETAVEVPVEQLGITGRDMLVSLIYTNSEFFALDARMYKAADGVVKFKLPPYSGIVLKNVPRRIFEHRTVD